MTGKKEAMQLSKSTSISIFDRGFPWGVIKSIFPESAWIFGIF